MRKKTAPQKWLIFFVVLLLVCLAGRLAFFPPAPSATVLPEGNRKAYTLSDSPLFVPCHILPEGWSPNSGEEGEMTVHTVDPSQVVTQTQASSIDRKTMNLALASAAPTDSQNIADRYISFELGGFGNAQDLVSANLAYPVSNHGTVSLTLNACSWLPSECGITVGLYCEETGQCWGYPLSGGTLTDTVLTFSDLPAGTYRPCIAPSYASAGMFYGMVETQA